MFLESAEVTFLSMFLISLILECTFSIKLGASALFCSYKTNMYLLRWFTSSFSEWAPGTIVLDLRVASVSESSVSLISLMINQMDVLSSSVFTMWTCNVFYFLMNSFDVFSVVVFMIRTVSTIIFANILMCEFDMRS